METIYKTQEQYDYLNLIISQSRNTELEFKSMEALIQQVINPNYKKSNCNCKSNRLKALAREALSKVEILNEGDKVCQSCGSIYQNPHHMSKYCDACK